MEEKKIDIVKNEIGRVDMLASRIESLITEARTRVVSFVNTAMVYTYYEIGRMIVEDEQGGDRRAEYGKNLMSALSKRLTQKFGRGFSERNIEQMRQFYLVYSTQNTIPQTVSAELENSSIVKANDSNKVEVQFTLSWSHYLKLMRISDPAERSFYEIEATQNHWSLVKLESENPTIGLLLCADKTDAMVEYSLPLNNNQIFASKYKTVLPSKEQLKKILMER